MARSTNTRRPRETAPADATDSARKRRAGVVTGALLLALGAVLLFRPSDEEKRVKKTSAEADSEDPSKSPRGAVEHAQSSPLVPSFEVERLRARLADYKRDAIYPPWSRMHTNGSEYLIHWNRPFIPELPLNDAPEGSAEQTIVRFGSDKAHVPAGEALTAWVEVVTGGEAGRRVPAQIDDGAIYVRKADGVYRTLDVKFRDDGREGDEVAGDFRYTARIVPSAEKALGGKSYGAHIEARVTSSGASRPYRREFTYAPRKTVEVLAARERIVDGSLEVTFDVQVHEAGSYTFFANVYSASGDTAIAYAERGQTLSAGKSTATLVFFGRAIRDSQIAGPYVVKDVRGMKRNDSSEGSDEANLWFTWDSELRTRPYPKDALSDREWDDAEKRQSIANFERLIDEVQSGAVGKPVAHARTILVGADGVERELNSEQSFLEAESTPKP
jgi:hypothetical protein